jgi:hypothetical protein
VALAHRRDAELEPVRDRAAACHACPDRAVVAVAEVGEPVPLLGRLLGDHVDRSAGRVAAVEGALWPAKHLDALGVEERRGGGRGAAQVDAVEVGGDTGVAAVRHVLVPDAADRDLRDRRIAAALREEEARHVHVEIRGVDDPLPLHRVRVEGGDRDGGVLHRALASFGRDRDVLDRLGRLRCGRGLLSE